MEKERGMADGVDKNDIENMLEILDSFANSEESRLKVEAVENLPQGTAQKQHHHGRCDIGSPWAKGQAFDVLE
ncbi:MAG: hypothetical protein HFJ08_02810 [Lachnospiraceae bacterium]|jgi:hypothetical protein|nr:hypothetical protein [Lachnospiraceae bacterium]MCX4375391.1 hypothetical protein [Lachnospiraceae bacterium]